MSYVAQLFVVSLDVLLDCLELVFDLILHQGSQQNFLLFLVSGEGFGIGEEAMGGGEEGRVFGDRGQLGGVSFDLLFFCAGFADFEVGVKVVVDN